LIAGRLNLSSLRKQKKTKIQKMTKIYILWMCIGCRLGSTFFMGTQCLLIFFRKGRIPDKISNKQLYNKYFVYG